MLNFIQNTEFSEDDYIKREVFFGKHLNDVRIKNKLIFDKSDLVFKIRLIHTLKIETTKTSTKKTLQQNIMKLCVEIAEEMNLQNDHAILDLWNIIYQEMVDKSKFSIKNFLAIFRALVF